MARNFSDELEDNYYGKFFFNKEHRVLDEKDFRDCSIAFDSFFHSYFIIDLKESTVPTQDTNHRSDSRSQEASKINTSSIGGSYTGLSDSCSQQLAAQGETASRTQDHTQAQKSSSYPAKPQIRNDDKSRALSSTQQDQTRRSYDYTCKPQT